MPPLLTAVGRGLLGRCPSCGQTHAFKGFLKVVPRCVVCDAPLGTVRADDAPPYFVVFLVGHMIVPLMFKVERAFLPPLWVHAALWIPLSLVLSVALLRPVKGATLGLMLRLGMVRPEEP